MANIKNFGIKGIGSDVQLGKSGGRFIYDSANGRFDLTASDGVTLENVRFANVESGTWQGTAISSAYGGTGADYSASSGWLVFNGDGSSSLKSSIDLTADVSGALPIANGGTGATDAATARTNLGLGTIATQDSDSVSITGGTVTGLSNLTSTDATFGNLTVTGTLTANISGTSDTALALQDGANISFTGNVISAAQNFDGSTDLIYNMELETILTAGSVGSGTAIPVITFDKYGRITATSTAAISSTLGLSADGPTSGSVDLLNSGLKVSGGSNISTNASGNVITVDLDDTITVGNITTTNNLTVQGTLFSDDITSQNVTIAGNLIVSGTQTVVNSQTVDIGDAVIRVNSDGATTSAGLEANINNTFESILFDPSEVVNPDGGDAGAWVISDDTRIQGSLFVDGTIVGANITGNAASADVLNDGANISFTGNVIAAAQNFDGSADLTYSMELETLHSGASVGSGTAIPVITYDKYGRVTGSSTAAISSTLNLLVDGDVSGSVDLLNGALSVDGGSNIDTAISGNVITVALENDVTLSGNLQALAVTDGTATLTGGALTGLTALGIDNVSIDGNTISSTNTNGDLILAPNGTGEVIIGNAGLPAELVAEDNQSLTLGGGDDLTGSAAGDLLLNGGDSTGAGAGGDVIIQGGTSATGTSGITQIKDANDNLVAEFTNATAGSATHLDFAAGSTNAEVTVDSTATDAGILFTPKGTGQLLVPSSYVPSTDDSLVDKGYVDSVLGASSLNISGTAGADSIDLDSETLAFVGSNSNLSTAVSANTVSIALNTTLTGLTSVTSTTFTGELTGNVTGQVSDISNHSTSDLAEGTNLYYTEARANSAIDARVTKTFVDALNVDADTLDGQDGAYYLDFTNFTNLPDPTITVDGDMSGSVTLTDLGNGTLSLTLDVVNTDAGVNGVVVNPGVSSTYGSATAIPVLTINEKGLVTASNTVAVSSVLDLSDGTVSSNVSLLTGELAIQGTLNETTVSLSGSTYTVGLTDSVTIADSLTVTNTVDATDINASGDVVIAGNLTVTGTQTIVNTQTLDVADNIIRVNTVGGATAGLVANVNGTDESIVFDPLAVINPDSNEPGAWVFSDDVIVSTTMQAADLEVTGDVAIAGNLSVNGTITGASISGNSGSATQLETARTIAATGDATWSVLFDGSADVTNPITLATVNSNVGTFGSATQIPVVTVNGKGLVTGVTTANVATTLNIAGDSGTDGVDLLADTVTFAGGSNITSTVTDNTVTFGLDSSISLTSVSATTLTDGTATLSGGDLSTVGNVSASTVTFSSLSDGTTSVSGIADSAETLTDTDTTIPTSGAIVDYVATVTGGASDGLLLRAAIGSGNTTADVGTMPNAAGRTYYANKVVVKVGTAFSGGSFDHITIEENGGAGTTIVAEADADAAAQGTYTIELDGDTTLTAGAAVTVSFWQAGGAVAATTTAGAMTVTVHYNWV